MQNGDGEYRDPLLRRTEPMQENVPAELIPYVLNAEADDQLEVDVLKTNNILEYIQLNASKESTEVRASLDVQRFLNDEEHRARGIKRRIGQGEYRRKIDELHPDGRFEQNTGDLNNIIRCFAKTISPTNKYTCKNM
ncbi:hypothetical protein Tcan_13676 [Toxocara canis]|uniref:Uncharacterized protein n=1 Tax=Toxocara canis TaxID=6265 RepID=A0A0B2VDM4_TOXCA|nr:hypothetical protein Tcan_13676 [Toxocara canis]